MAYRLKSTGIAANCTMLVAVDPDLNIIKEFASSSVNSTMAVGANVTIASQAWNGTTRSYFKYGAGTTNADYVVFGTNKPQWTNDTDGMARTWVFIGQVGTSSQTVRVFGKDSTNMAYSNDTATGGSTYPFQAGLGFTVKQNGGAAQPALGTKVIFGCSQVHGAGANGAAFYWSTDAAGTMSKLSLTGPSGGSTANMALDAIGRRNDTTAHGDEKIHMIAIFYSSLSDSDWESLHSDWFGTLLEVIPTSGPTINTQPSNQSVTAGTAATFTVTATSSGGTLTYQWQRSTDGGSSYSNVTTGTGGTTASYTTDPTTVSGGTANNGDKYQVVVTDSNGNVTSTAATLTVTAPSSGNGPIVVLMF